MHLAEYALKWKQCLTMRAGAPQNISQYNEDTNAQKRTRMYNEVQWSTMKYNEVQWSTKKYNEVQRSTMKYNEV